MDYSTSKHHLLAASRDDGHCLLKALPLPNGYLLAIASDDGQFLLINSLKSPYHG
jgi:hypothetical protein